MAGTYCPTQVTSPTLDAVSSTVPVTFTALVHVGWWVKFNEGIFCSAVHEIDCAAVDDGQLPPALVMFTFGILSGVQTTAVTAVALPPLMLGGLTPLHDAAVEVVLLPASEVQVT